MDATQDGTALALEELQAEIDALRRRCKRATRLGFLALVACAALVVKLFVLPGDLSAKDMQVRRLLVVDEGGNVTAEIRRTSLLLGGQNGVIPHTYLSAGLDGLQIAGETGYAQLCVGASAPSFEMRGTDDRKQRTGGCGVELRATGRDAGLTLWDSGATPGGLAMRERGRFAVSLEGPSTLQIFGPDGKPQFVAPAR